MQNIYWLIAGLVLFELVTIPLYVHILYVLATNKEFNNPFFRLILAMGIVELIHFASDFIFIRLPMIEGIADFYVGLPEGRWMGLSFLTRFCVYSQFLFHFVISLTRFTAIWTPRQHKELWTKAWRYIIVLISAIAFGLSSDIFFSVAKYQYADANDPSKGALKIFVRFDFPQFPYYFTMVVGTFTIIACLLINALVMGKIYYKKRKGCFKNADKLEINMLFITLFMMIPQLVMSGAYGIVVCLHSDTENSICSHLSEAANNEFHNTSCKPAVNLIRRSPDKTDFAIFANFIFKKEWPVVSVLRICLKTQLTMAFAFGTNMPEPRNYLQSGNPNLVAAIGRIDTLNTIWMVYPMDKCLQVQEWKTGCHLHRKDCNIIKTNPMNLLFREDNNQKPSRKESARSPYRRQISSIIEPTQKEHWKWHKIDGVWQKRSPDGRRNNLPRGGLTPETPSKPVARRHSHHGRNVAARRRHIGRSRLGKTKHF